MGVELKKLAQMQILELAFVFLSACPGSSFLHTGVQLVQLLSGCSVTSAGKNSSETGNKQIKNWGWKMLICLVVLVQLLRVYTPCAVDDQGREKIRAENTRECVVRLTPIKYTELQTRSAISPVSPTCPFVCPVFPAQASAIFVQLLTHQWCLNCNLRASVKRLVKASCAYP